MRWRAAILVIAGVLAYANSISGPFILDDQSTIADNRQIREWWRPSSVLVPEADTAIAGRPVVNLSFAVNYAIGGIDVRGYHVANIALHLVCGLLAFGILRRTFALPRLRDRFGSAGVHLAFAAALLWVVHPVNSEVVDYLTERTESLMALFYLLTVYAGIRAIDGRVGAQAPAKAGMAGPAKAGMAGPAKAGHYVRERAGRAPSARAPEARPDPRWHAIAIASCALGMACKESMVTAPLIVVLYDRVFVFDSFAEAMRARRGLYAGLAATWVVLAALMWSGPRSAVGGFSTGISPWTYILNQTQVITRYLGLAFWPRSLVVFYGWPLPLTLADVLPYALLIVLLLAATIVALVRAPALGFLGAWFFITLAPTSSIVPVATEVGAERRMYLPLLGLIALTVVGAFLVWQRLRGTSTATDAAARVPRLLRDGALAGTAMLVLVAGTLIAFTVIRNREYATPVTLARTVIARRPTAVTHHYLAEQLAQVGLHDEAIQHLREAVAGGDSRAGFLLGIELFNAGKLNEAVPQLEAFVATSGLSYRLVPHWLEPPLSEVITARLVLARVASMRGRWPQAAEQARVVLAMAPGNREARMFLADALFGQERYTEAGQEYRQYLQAQPGDAHALTNLGIALIAEGKLDEAIVLFRRTVDADPRNANLRRILGMALLDRGDPEGAIVQAREGVALNPADPALRDLLNRASAAGKGRQ